VEIPTELERRPDTREGEGEGRSNGFAEGDYQNCARLGTIERSGLREQSAENLRSLKKESPGSLWVTPIKEATPRLCCKGKQRKRLEGGREEGCVSDCRKRNSLKFFYKKEPLRRPEGFRPITLQGR